MSVAYYCPGHFIYGHLLSIVKCSSQMPIIRPFQWERDYKHRFRFTLNHMGLRTDGVVHCTDCKVRQ